MEASETSIGAGLLAPVEAGTPTVSIVIPAFNEAGRIVETIRKIEAFVRRAPYLTEIIVVMTGPGTIQRQLLASFKRKGCASFETRTITARDTPYVKECWPHGANMCSSLTRTFPPRS